MTPTTFALPVMTERGASHAVAVFVASSVGPMQVAGRLVLTLPGLRVRTGTLARAVALGMSVSSLALLVATGDLWLFAIYAVGQGAAIGVQSILRPLITAEALGEENFGAISGALAMAPIGAGALAPFLGALLMGAGGVTLLLSVTLSFALTGFAIGLWLRARGI